MFSDIKTLKGINTTLLLLFGFFFSFIGLPSLQPSTDVAEIAYRTHGILIRIMRFNSQLYATNKYSYREKKFLKPKAKVFIIYWKFPSLFHCDKREKKKSLRARILADNHSGVEHFSTGKKGGEKSFYLMSL